MARKSRKPKRMRKQYKSLDIAWGATFMFPRSVQRKIKDDMRLLARRFAKGEEPFGTKGLRHVTILRNAKKPEEYGYFFDSRPVMPLDWGERSFDCMDYA